MLDHLSFPSGECVQWDINGNQTYDTISAGNAVLCITSDSRVKTLRRCVRGADLKVGDLVWTLDHGYQPIRWIGTKTLSGAQLETCPKNRPLRISRHALGRNRPARDLLVSPQHRILGRLKRAERLFGVSEVLVPAIKLLDLAGMTK